jgi:hypothetical protein
MAVQANLLAARLTKPARRVSRRGAFWLAFGIGIASLALSTWLTFKTNSDGLLIVLLVVLGGMLLSPVVVAAVTAILSARNVRSEGFQLVRLTNVSDGNIVWAHILASLLRFRILLAVLVGLMPVIVVGILDMQLYVTAIFVNLIYSCYQQPCPPATSTLPSTGDWLKSGLAIIVGVIGLWGLNVLAAALGTFAALRWQRASAAATMALGSILVVLAVAIYVFFSLRTELQGIVFVSALAILCYLSAVLMAELARRWVRKGDHA